jgi:ubiquinone/menaquinone biosynthesis C-methylase UbiE
MNFMRARSVETLRRRRKRATNRTGRSTAQEGPHLISAMSLRRVLLSWLVLVAPLAAQKPEPLYELRQEHDRNGIGKFFMGREIAQVMGHQGADWLERPEREEEEGTDRLLEALALKPGEVVADIGAGSGYLSWRMARAVGPTGKIYAVDIQQEMLDLLMRNMAKRRVQETVKPVLGTIQDPKLPRASCDTMIMVDVYHEFDEPFEMVENMIAGLKPGGRIVFVEYRGEDPNVPIKLVHKMTEAQVKKEMGAHTLEFVETIGVLPRQHIIIFRKPAAKSADGKACCEIPASRAALLTRAAVK